MKAMNYKNEKCLFVLNTLGWILWKGKIQSSHLRSEDKVQQRGLVKRRIKQGKRKRTRRRFKKNKNIPIKYSGNYEGTKKMRRINQKKREPIFSEHDKEVTGTFDKFLRSQLRNKISD